MAQLSKALKGSAQSGQLACTEALPSLLLIALKGVSRPCYEAESTALASLTVLSICGSYCRIPGGQIRRAYQKVVIGA